MMISRKWVAVDVDPYKPAGGRVGILAVIYAERFSKRFGGIQLAFPNQQGALGGGCGHGISVAFDML